MFKNNRGIFSVRDMKSIECVLAPGKSCNFKKDSPLKTSETHRRKGLSIGRKGGEKLSVRGEQIKNG